MSRTDFKRLMKKVFGGGYSRTGGDVTAREVSAALVRKLGYGGVARRLARATSPDGWDPGTVKSFGTEVVARELGLRHDRDTSEEGKEAGAEDSMRQADVVYAVWRASTDPSTWGADALESFSLANYDSKRRQVIRFALSLVGTPYVYGGEWAGRTPSSYPYGAQPHGGLDCSGFSWYVLQEKSSSWSPPRRNYAGWSLPQRSSTDMAQATKQRIRYRDLRPADVLFFAPGGKGARNVYHVGLYLGDGWMIHSSGSRAGVSLAQVSKGSYWRDELVFGRRVIR
jgi:cell wall-associated NlpC family hydrolase